MFKLALKMHYYSEVASGRCTDDFGIFLAKCPGPRPSLIKLQRYNQFYLKASFIYLKDVS